MTGQSVCKVSSSYALVLENVMHGLNLLSSKEIKRNDHGSDPVAKYVPGDSGDSVSLLLVASLTLRFIAVSQYKI